MPSRASGCAGCRCSLSHLRKPAHRGYHHFADSIALAMMTRGTRRTQKRYLSFDVSEGALQALRIFSIEYELGTRPGSVAHGITTRQFPRHRVQGISSNPLGDSNPCTTPMAIQDRFALLVALLVCFRAMDSRRPDAIQVEIVLWRGTQEHPDPRTIMGMPCVLFFTRPAGRIDLPSPRYKSRQGRRQAAM